VFNGKQSFSHEGGTDNSEGVIIDRLRGVSSSVRIGIQLWFWHLNKEHKAIKSLDLI